MSDNHEQAQDGFMKEFLSVKGELDRLQARLSGVIAETFQCKSLDDIACTPENLDALKRILAYEVRKQDYFSQWLKSQQKGHARTEEGHGSGGAPETASPESQPVILILTVDLTGAKPWALAKIEKGLAALGFAKYRSGQGSPPQGHSFPGFATAANIFFTELGLEKDSDIDVERDRVNGLVKEMMDRERGRGAIEEYRYILFASRQWSWKEESTS